MTLVSSARDQRKGHRLCQAAQEQWSARGSFYYGRGTEGTGLESEDRWEAPGWLETLTESLLPQFLQLETAKAPS